MAPLRKLKTYESKCSRYNELQSAMKSGKVSKRRNRTPLLKDLTPCVEKLFEDSLEVSLDDTFDKLKRGPMYNMVNFKDRSNVITSSRNNPVNNKDSSSKNNMHVVVTRSKFTNLANCTDDSSLLQNKVSKELTPTYDHLDSFEIEVSKKNRNETDSFVIPHKKREQSAETSFDISNHPIGNTMINSLCDQPIYYSTPILFLRDKTLPKEQDSLKLNDSEDLVQCTPKKFVTKRRKVLLCNKIKNYRHNLQENSDGSILQHHHSEDKLQTSIGKTPKFGSSDSVSQQHVSEYAQSKTSIKTTSNLDYDNSASEDLFSEYAQSQFASKNTSKMDSDESISQQHTPECVQSENSIIITAQVECDNDVSEQPSKCAQPETSVRTVTPPTSEIVHLNSEPRSSDHFVPKGSIIIDLTEDVDEDNKPTVFRLPNRISKPGKSWRRWLHENSPGEEIPNFKRQSRRSTLKIIPLVLHRPMKLEVVEELDTIWESFGNISLKALEDETAENSLLARDNVLLKCGQKEPESFEALYNKKTLINCKKIGEGTFGEVFSFEMSPQKTCVMKIMPIEGDQLVNGEEQKKFCEILSEITIAKALSNLRKSTINFTDTFNEVYKVRCVQGVYPSILLKQWEIFDQNKGSENDNPCMFKFDQLYIVLELKNGGTSLEDYQFKNSSQSYYMFQQVAFALAVAENVLKFEHRDLHWGNILLAEENANETVKFQLNGIDCCIPTKGVRVTIIDFTLSRVESEQMVIFNNLAEDEELFEGDAKVDYQFDIYRLMKEKNGNNWQKFEPYSNLLWLHYLLDKAVHSVKYLRKTSVVHKAHIKKLEALKSEILSYDSVTNFVMSKFISTDAQENTHP